MKLTSSLIFAGSLVSACAQAQQITVATFNVSMESTNYPQMKPGPDLLAGILASGENQQVKNIAEIIQRVNPDIILLNEFDYIADQSKGVKRFISNYLQVSQHGQAPTDFPYVYTSTVNTGEPTPFDLDNNGKTTRYGGDAYGFGLYPGQYGMVLLSKYPIVTSGIHTLQHFKWHDMPNARMPVDPATGYAWYNEAEWDAFRLSSKSHWDIPVDIDGQVVHILAMHPTPPTFDGEEDRNGKRNHDEIRLMADYLTPGKGSYIYDDQGQSAGLGEQTRFVLLGDFNAADIGDKHRPDVIEQLTASPLVNNSIIPQSKGGAELNSEDFSKRFTAHWGARADYVLPSTYGITVKESGVFWPAEDDPLFRLVDGREASSDHRMVWVKMNIEKGSD